MHEHNTMDQEYSNQDFSSKPLVPGEYECCIFNSCIFAKADLRNIKFTDCTFNECDLSMVNFFGTGLRSCLFNNCKMLAIAVHEVNKFLLSFKANKCNFNHSSFANLDLKKSSFSECQFEECNFENTNLSACKLEKCDFPRADFYNTNLQGTDLSTCTNFIINPDENQISKAIFSKENIAGLLGKYDIEIT